MAAECLNETGSVTDRQKAINYLNIVREKRGIQRKLGNDLSQSVVQQEILKEWRKMPEMAERGMHKIIE